jgi:hypothetical protein
MEDTSKPGPGGEQAQAISIRFRSSEPSFKCSGSSKVVKRYGANDTVGDLLFSIEDLVRTCMYGVLHADLHIC